MIAENYVSIVIFVLFRNLVELLKLWYSERIGI